jgi:hypothetical protein
MRSESDPGVCSDLEAHVAPKLVDLMMMCLEEEAQAEGHSEGEGDGQGAPSCLEAVTVRGGGGCPACRSVVLAPALGTLLGPRVFSIHALG